jgi:hypothetical protein
LTTLEDVFLKIGEELGEHKKPKQPPTNAPAGELQQFQNKMNEIE